MTSSDAPTPLPGPPSPPELAGLTLDAFPMGITVADGQGRILQTNEAAQHLLGVPTQIHLARTIQDPAWQLIWPNGTPLPVEAIPGVRALREQVRVEEPEVGVLRPDGTTAWLSITATPSGPDRLLITYADASALRERRQMEARLGESEQAFRSYVEQSIDVIFTLDAQGTFVFASPAWERHFGYPVSEILGRPFAPFVHPDDVGPCMAYLLRVLATGQPGTSPPYRVRHAYGSWRWFLANGAAMTTATGERHFIGVAHDITESRESEDALRESEARYRGLLQGIESVAVQSYGPDGITRYWNRASERLYGYSAEEAVGRNLLDLIIPEEMREQVERDIKHMWETGHPLPSAELTLKRKDGSPVVVFTHHASVHIPGREPELFCMDVDLTERKRMEEALKASEERYRTQFNLAGEGIITMSFDGELLEANEAMARMHGYTREELLQMNLKDLDTPETLQQAPGRMRRILAGESLTFEVEHHHKDGHTFPVEVTANLIQSGGKPVILSFQRDITERVHSNQALLESERRLRSYMENAPIAVFTSDETGRYLRVNPAASAITGYSREELLACSIPDLIPPEWQAFAGRHFAKLVEEGSSSGELGFRHKDGHTGFWTVDAVRLSPTRFLGFASDITERKRAEAALRESEEQLRVIFEASGAGIILVAPTGEITFANRRMAEMFGVTQEALIGTGYLGHLHPSELEQSDLRMRLLMEGAIESVFVERRYIRADGTDFWGHLSGRRLQNPDGSMRALVGIITDVTSRHQAEEQQRFLSAQLHQAQKMESLGSLAGGVAHDMNNVLGAILGLASAHIESQPAGSSTHRAFGTIIKAAERGGNMLKSLLSFTRQNTAEVRELDLNAILREEVRLLERTTLAKVRLVLDLAPDLRCILGDPGALTHAFMNLSVNAVDAMPENGELTLRTRNLDSDWIEVQVQDTGHGMPREILEKALDPFFTTKEVGKGTGLGLSIVYSTVKAHQGQMELQSEPGQGTCVIMRFPACVLPVKPAEPSGAYRTMPARGALKVLLVDDDELIQSSMQGILELMGHTVTVSPSGEEALVALQAGLKPDVVILDMNMPGLGGAGTLPRLRTLLPTVPVLLATGRADQAAQDLIDAHTHVTLLSKPFGMRELQAYLAPLTS